MSVGDLASDPIIVGMAMDLHFEGILPPPEGSVADDVFKLAAAMEFVRRGGEPGDLEFDDPARAVREALANL